MFSPSVGRAHGLFETESSSPRLSRTKTNEPKRKALRTNHGAHASIAAPRMIATALPRAANAGGWRATIRCQASSRSTHTGIVSMASPHKRTSRTEYLHPLGGERFDSVMRQAETTKAPVASDSHSGKVRYG